MAMHPPKQAAPAGGHHDVIRRISAGVGGTAAQCAAPGAAISNKKETGVQDDSGFADQSKKDAKNNAKDNPKPRREDMARVLVVDDDPMVCMAIEVYLERHNFHVTIADGGEAGLRALDSQSFDLMIVDIFMPHMRGFESIRIFHERAPSVPLIAMSGYAFANLNTPAPDFLRMALELGASRCLRKPFTPAALLAVINECLAEVRDRYPNKMQLR
jgi:CheY-like chemotaxis protein